MTLPKPEPEGRLLMRMNGIRVYGSSFAGDLHSEDGKLLLGGEDVTAEAEANGGWIDLDDREPSG